MTSKKKRRIQHETISPLQESEDVSSKDSINSKKCNFDDSLVINSKIASLGLKEEQKHFENREMTAILPTYTGNQVFKPENPENTFYGLMEDFQEQTFILPDKNDKLTSEPKAAQHEKSLMIYMTTIQDTNQATTIADNQILECDDLQRNNSKKSISEKEERSSIAILSRRRSSGKTNAEKFIERQNIIKIVQACFITHNKNNNNPLNEIITHIARSIVTFLEEDQLEDCLENLNESLQALNKFQNEKYNIDPQGIIELYSLCSGAQASVSRVFDLNTKISYAQRIANLNTQKMHSTLKEIVLLLKLIQLDNPALIKIFNISLQKSKLIILMEYGLGSLSSFISYLKSSNQQLNPNEGKIITSELYSQLKLLRANHIYHRDIKPDNIIISEDWSFKLTDFGVSDIFESSAYEKGEHVIRGTPSYWPEEICKAWKNNERTVACDLWENDLYALNKVKEKLGYFGEVEFETQNQLAKKSNHKDTFEEYQRQIIFEKLRDQGPQVAKLFEDNEILDEAVLWIQKQIDSRGDKKSFGYLHLSLSKADILLKMQKFGECEKICHEISQDISKQTKANSKYSTDDSYFLDTINTKILNPDLSRLNSMEHCQAAREYLLGELNLIVGSIYHSQSNFESAIEAFKTSQNFFEKTLGGINPRVAKIYSNLGTVFSDQAKYPDALESLIKSQELLLKLEGPESTAIAETYLKIGNLHSDQDLYPQALEYVNKALEMMTRLVGPHHTLTSDVYLALGNIFSSQDQFASAREYYTKALDIYTKVFGKEHSTIANCYYLLGDLYLDQEDSLEAMDYYEMSRKMYKKLYGEYNTQVAYLYQSLGILDYKVGAYDSALRSYNTALRINQKILDPNHTSFATLYQNIGNVLCELGRYDEAIDNFNKSLNIKIKRLGPYHTTVANSYISLGTVYSDQEDYMQALSPSKYETEKLKIFQMQKKFCNLKK